ncbi:hypothetical protein HCG51_34395 (plasmid) [Tolypothrix sp. PCC 7910]|uniref:hypothetical protein n=1 Tax=Tolypothrix sp. PCC 7910 TaxID=2099387 RepID=UPI00142799ED|nr:hypothetical protein [Tolypothrix sp. PCC 7910]QIR41776.1 hypothetical protein HCG51_34395 [Tolypothrix sp. PCC 7910]
MYYGYRCYNKEDEPLGWLYTFDCDTEYTWTNKELHLCKRWKTERGAKKHFDSYNSRWQFKSKGGYLKIEIMPDIPEPESKESRRQKILEEWGDDVVIQPQNKDHKKSTIMSFSPKNELLEWLEEERWTDDNGKPETDAALLNRKLEKLRKLEQQGF